MKSIIAVFLAIAISAIIFAVLPTKKSTVIGTDGYWRIENDNGVWWFLSPNGNREFLNSVQSVQPKQYSKDTSQPSFVSADYSGDIDAWAKTTADRVKSYGFKSVGAWSNSALSPYIPYSRDLNLSKCTNLSIDQDGWENDIEKAVIKQVSPLKQDVNLIGY